MALPRTHHDYLRFDYGLQDLFVLWASDLMYCSGGTLCASVDQVNAYRTETWVYKTVDESTGIPCDFFFVVHDTSFKKEERVWLYDMS